MPAEEVVPKFCSLFARTTLRVVNRARKKRVENITRLISGADLDADENPCHVEKINCCKRILHERRDEELAADGFAKEIVKQGRALSASGAVLCKKNVLAVLRRQRAVRSWQRVLFSSPDVLE